MNIPDITVRASQYSSEFFCVTECQWTQYCLCSVIGPDFPFPCAAWTYTLVGSGAPGGARFCEAEAEQRGLLQECLRRR